VQQAEMRKIFNQFDQDGNGLLDEFEILDALRSLWYVIRFHALATSHSIA